MFMIYHQNNNSTEIVSLSKYCCLDIFLSDVINVLFQFSYDVLTFSHQLLT